MVISVLIKCVNWTAYSFSEERHDQTILNVHYTFQSLFALKKKKMCRFINFPNV